MIETSQEKTTEGIKLPENEQEKNKPEETSKDRSKLDRKKIDAFLDAAKKQASSFYGFFKDNRNNSKITLILALSTSALAVFFGMQLYSDITVLNAKSSDLVNLSSYDIRTLQSNPTTRTVLKNVDTIKDLIDENDAVVSEMAQYANYIQSLQIPYTYLLKYIYLPSLNVRKDYYTEKIDTNLIGIKFLEKNPYDDIRLMQKRSDFFKNLGDNNESNEIMDLKIGDIAEDAKGFFSMPITVSFEASSRRAFLLLADKLSMTSNKENISLINEFFYYLRGEIKKSKDQEIKALTKDYSNIFGTGEEINQDKMIGYSLYNRIFNNGKNTMIDDKLIDRTIKSIISCNNENDEVCYYRFREKYRDIPMLGYLLGTDFGTNGAENLRNFMKQLPPIFSIQEFDFDKMKSLTLADTSNTKYKGTVTISVYGRSATVQEVDEIAKALGNKCFEKDMTLSPQEGLTLIQDAIGKLSDINNIDKSYGDNLIELKTIVVQLDTDFPKLSNYRKTIRIFELYRMLYEAGLCK